MHQLMQRLRPPLFEKKSQGMELKPISSLEKAREIMSGRRSSQHVYICTL
jgi:hypothetical protein